MLEELLSEGLLVEEVEELVREELALDELLLEELVLEELVLEESLSADSAEPQLEEDPTATFRRFAPCPEERIPPKRKA